MAILKNFVYLVVFYSFSSVSVVAQNVSSELTKKLDSISLADVPPGAPGIATAILQNGKLIYSKTAGIANFEDSSRISASTQFNIASNGKQFTALLILLLEQKGQLSLNDDIRMYLPGIFPLIKAPIRIRHLINHTSGIRDVYDLWALTGITWWKQDFTNTDAIQLLYKQQELNFSPGSDYLYSNSNYILLAALVEKRTKQSFSKFANQVFRELGMQNTFFKDSTIALSGQIARAYFNFSSWTTYSWTWNICGDGNLFTTLNDQIRWEQIVQGKIKIKQPAALLKKLAHPLENDQPNYGYGLEFGNHRSIPILFHEGATGAWKATLIRVPSKKWALLTFTNSGKTIPSQQTRKMLDVLLDKEAVTKPAISYKPSTVGPPITNKEITGLYLTKQGYSFEFLEQETGIYLRRYGRNDVLLERESPAVLRQKYDPTFQLEFKRSLSGRLQVTAFHPTHAPYTLEKNEFAELKTPYLFAGQYLNTETAVSMRLISSTNQSFIYLIGSDTTIVRLINDTTGIAGEDQYVIRLSDRKVTELLLSRQRLRNIRFRKVE